VLPKDIGDNLQKADIAFFSLVELCEDEAPLLCRGDVAPIDGIILARFQRQGPPPTLVDEIVVHTLGFDLGAGGGDS
jgi:hypothetical protein